jgi:hypothetical protein
MASGLSPRLSGAVPPSATAMAASSWAGARRPARWASSVPAEARKWMSVTSPGVAATTPLTVSTGIAVQKNCCEMRRPGRATSSRRSIMYEQFSSKNQ